jgi:hypothetical protein
MSDKHMQPYRIQQLEQHLLMRLPCTCLTRVAGAAGERVLGLARMSDTFAAAVMAQAVLLAVLVSPVEHA